MRKLILLLAAAAALVPAASASATTTIPSGCSQWALDHQAFHQSNGWDARFDFRTAAFSTFDGRASSYDNRGNFAGFGWVRGTLFGDELNFSITWDSGPVGIYHATINRFGQAFGTSWDMRSPWSKATWAMYPDARCSYWKPY